MINDSIDNLRLDINKPKARASISIRKGDTKTRTIHISLTSNGAVYSLENALMAELLINKPDGNVCDQDMVIKGNELQYTFRTQDTNVEGECVCQIRLTFKDGARLISPEFYMYVYNMILDNKTSQSENEYSQTDALLVKANEYYENAEELVKRVEDTGTTAVNAQIKAEEAASEAETYYLWAKDFAEQAENSKDVAAVSEANAVTTLDEVKAQAEIATEKATEAAASATAAENALAEVIVNATNAANSAKTSEDQAIISTTQALNAKTQAEIATDKVSEANTILAAVNQKAEDAENAKVAAENAKDLAEAAAEKASAVAAIDIATTTVPGIIKPDGDTITVAADGTAKAKQPNLSPYAMKTEIPDISGKADKTELDNYALKTEIPDISGKADKTELDDYALKTEIPDISDKADKTEIPDISGKADRTELPTIATNAAIGLVKPDGNTITIDPDGTLHGSATVSIATEEQVGVVKPDGDTITIDPDGTIHAITVEPSSIIIVQFKDSKFIGEVCTLTTETFAYFATVDSNLKATFGNIKELGEMTITCACLSKVVNTYNYTNYMFTMDSLTEVLLSKARITNTYNSLADVFENEIDTRRIMTIHASADFLIEWYNSFNDVLDTIIASNYAMKWIGLRDYICDKFMDIDDVKTAFLESDNWEYILKDHVPVMTSDTAPYGEASGSSAYETSGKRMPYNAFDGILNTFGNHYQTAGLSSPNVQWIQYKFVNPTKINKMYVLSLPLGVPLNENVRGYSGILQGSNDGVNFDDLLNITIEHSQLATILYYDVDNNNYYLYYRYVIETNNYVQNGKYMNAIAELQFYGRSLNVSVPTMTSNTEPYGVAFASAEPIAQHAIYKAFDKNSDTTSTRSMWTATAPGWIGYDIKKDTLMKFIFFEQSADGGLNQPISFTLQASNDNVNYENLDTFSLTKAANAKHYFAVNNNTPYRYYRISFNISDCTNGWIYVGELNFYGVDYSEREFAEGSTIHYIYDHGLELEELDKTSIQGASDHKLINATIYDDYIMMPLSSDVPGSCTINAKNSINLTDYNYVCVVNDLQRTIAKANISNVNQDAFVIVQNLRWSTTDTNNIASCTIARKLYMFREDRISVHNICDYAGNMNVYELYLE